MKDRFLRMNANFDTGRVSGEAPNILNKSVYILSFTNVGPRPITVTNYEWKLPLAKIKRCITFPNLDPSVTHLCTKFPTELTDGKGGIIFHANHFFRSMDDPEDFLYPKSYISAWLKIRFFKMYMSTSVGKKIKVKVHARVRQALWTEYKAINA